MKEIKYPSGETIKKLTKELGLKKTSEFTQDWEYEVADANQLAAYIEYYQKSLLNINERATLMRIVLESYNDYITLKNDDDDEYGEIIKSLIKKDYSIHKEVIKTWACEGEESLEDCFYITPFIRDICRKDSN